MFRRLMKFFIYLQDLSMKVVHRAEGIIYMALDKIINYLHDLQIRYVRWSAWKKEIPNKLVIFTQRVSTLRQSLTSSRIEIRALKKSLHSTKSHSSLQGVIISKLRLENKKYEEALGWHIEGITQDIMKLPKSERDAALEEIKTLQTDLFEEEPPIFDNVCFTTVDVDENPNPPKNFNTELAKVQSIDDMKSFMRKMKQEMKEKDAPARR